MRAKFKNEYKNSFNAAVLYKQKKNLKITNLKYKKLPENYVLVKMKYTSICRSQIFEIDGLRGKDKYIPHLLGHEGTGKIIKLGENVKNFEVNDNVLLTWIRSKKKKFYNIKFVDHNNKNINSGPISTFNTHAIISKHCLHKLPKKVNNKIGVLLGCAFPTGAGMINNHANIKNKKILVIGLGNVGLSCLIMANYYQTDEIFIYDKKKSKIDQVKKILKNKIKLIDLKDKNFLNYFDYIFESSGDSKIINKSIKFLKSNGKCVFASHPSKGKKIIIDPYELIKGKKIEGSWGGGTKYPKDLIKLSRALNLSKLKRLYFKKIYTLNTINSAIKDFKKGKVLKPLIKLN